MEGETLTIITDPPGEGVKVNATDSFLLEVLCEGLIKGRKISAIWNERKLEVGELIERLSIRDEKLWEKVTVCVDLRNRGRQVKSGPFNNSLLIKSGSSFNTLIYIVSQNEELKLGELMSWAENQRRLSLETVLAVVDRSGDVTYYSFSSLHTLK
ncbi:hypothetical protein [Sulfodiicoccus acidiphilus]|uniref:hypothetical protein n=1 Tax=Sulfodiicoccus acidiphilus TaxID=1670455 RepID=UPI00131529E8|nr:hypothetical protein [Sulfodiicoccus acidiphilus]